MIPIDRQTARGALTGVEVAEHAPADDSFADLLQGVEAELARLLRAKSVAGSVAGPISLAGVPPAAPRLPPPAELSGGEGTAPFGTAKGHKPGLAEKPAPPDPPGAAGASVPLADAASHGSTPPAPPGEDAKAPPPQARPLAALVQHQPGAGGAAAAPLALELTLPGLGLMRFQLTPAATGWHVVVMAEAATTQDMLRRQSGLLQDEFHRIGFAEVEVEVAVWDRPSPPRPSPGTDRSVPDRPVVLTLPSIDDPANFPGPGLTLRL